jgi:hypothetical protein
MYFFISKAKIASRTAADRLDTAYSVRIPPLPPLPGTCRDAHPSLRARSRILRSLPGCPGSFIAASSALE